MCRVARLSRLTAADAIRFRHKTQREGGPASHDLLAGLLEESRKGQTESNEAKATKMWRSSPKKETWHIVVSGCMREIPRASASVYRYRCMGESRVRFCNIRNRVYNQSSNSVLNFTLLSGRLTHSLNLTLLTGRLTHSLQIGSKWPDSVS